MIETSYIEFKDIVLNRKLWWQYVIVQSTYVIFVIDSSIEFKTVVNFGSEEATDFETNYKDEANRPLNLSQSSTTSVFGGDGSTCWGIVPENESSGYIEWTFTEDLYFNKMYAIIKDAEWAEGEVSGDYVTVTVHLPDGTKIRDYSGNIPCWGNQPQGWMEGTGAGKLPAYLKLRVTYYKGPNTSTAIRRFAMIPEFLK